MIRPFLVFTPAASIVRAETYYLAPDGKDSAKGTSADAPWRTFYKINDRAIPGDTFIVAAGTFELGKTFPTLTRAGTAEAPIRIEAAKGALPRLRFEGWRGIKIGPGAAYLEIAGMDIEGASGSITLDEAKADPAPKKSGRLNGNGISIDGRSADQDRKPRPHPITLRDVRIWACPGGGISAMQGDYLTVEDCTVSARAWYSIFACSGIFVWQAWNFDREPGYDIRIRLNRCDTDLFRTTQDSKRWSIFRCGPESHNLLRFDDAPQRVDATAEISPAPSTEGAHGFIVDLTPVVRDQVTTARRRFTLRPDRSVIIRDEWRTGDKTTEVTWQWLTQATAAAEPDGLVLRQSGESLHLRATASSPLTFAIEDISQPRNKFDSSNPGLSRLIIRLTTPRRSDGAISVTASPDSAKQP